MPDGQSQRTNMPKKLQDVEVIAFLGFRLSDFKK